MTDMTGAMGRHDLAGLRATGRIAWLDRTARRLRRLLSVLKLSRLADAADDLGRRVGASVTPPVLERELVTIDSFARYLAVNPDMPLEHRERFLRQIRESCDAVRREMF